MYPTVDIVTPAEMEKFREQVLAGTNADRGDSLGNMHFIANLVAQTSDDGVFMHVIMNFNGADNDVKDAESVKLTFTQAEWAAFRAYVDETWREAEEGRE